MAVSLEKMMRGYLGFLVGTGKSQLTISSYRSDLLVFQEFMRETKRDFISLQPKDFEAYHHFLKKTRFKNEYSPQKINYGSLVISLRANTQKNTFFPGAIYQTA